MKILGGFLRVFLLVVLFVFTCRCSTPTYVTSKYITSDAPIDDSLRRPSQRGILHVRFEPANLHAEPGLDELIVSKVWRSTDLSCIMETDYWIKVEAPGGIKGWIAKTWVQKEELPTDKFTGLEIKKPLESSASKTLADNTPPVIEVFSPKSARGIPIIWRYDTVVGGIARDDSGIAWVTVNGTNSALDEQGKFNLQVYLKVGRNDVEIKAMDTRGNVGTKIVTINRKASKEIAKAPQPANSITPLPQLIYTKTLKPTLWILAIGVSDYKKKELSLNFADNDAIKLTEVLKKQQGRLYSEVQAKVLLNEDTSRESILTAMGSFLGQAALDDVVFIFVAGHGIQHKATGSYYFLPYDANSQNLMVRGLRWSDFEETIKVLSRNVNKLILAIDTCHAGAMKIAFRGAEPGEDLAAILQQASGLYTLAASKRGEESEEHDSFRLQEESKGHGAFTYALLKGLLGEANYDGNEYITISELFNFVAKRVPRITKGKQHPYARISGTDLPIAAVR